MGRRRIALLVAFAGVIGAFAGWFGMRRSVIAGSSAIGAALALVIGASVVWPGLDAQQTPETDASVWVLQSDGQQYARVNTAIGELDTVRTVANPSRIATTPSSAFLFTDSDSRIARIDEADPQDVDSAALADAESAPTGTQEVVTAGDYVAYRTDAGAVYAGRLVTAP